MPSRSTTTGSYPGALRHLRKMAAATVEACEDLADTIGGEIVTTVTAISSVPVFPRSAAGEPPRLETGQLTDRPPSPDARRKRRPGKAGWQHEVRRHARGVSARVWTEVPHARWLEFGTRFMQPRPALRPTVRTITVGLSRRTAATIRLHQDRARSRMGG